MTPPEDLFLNVNVDEAECPALDDFLNTSEKHVWHFRNDVLHTDDAIKLESMLPPSGDDCVSETLGDLKHDLPYATASSVSAADENLSASSASLELHHPGLQQPLTLPPSCIPSLSSYPGCGATSHVVEAVSTTTPASRHGRPTGGGSCGGGSVRVGQTDRDGGRDDNGGGCAPLRLPLAVSSQSYAAHVPRGSLDCSNVTDGGSADGSSCGSGTELGKNVAKPPTTAGIHLEDLKKVFHLERPKAEKELQLKRTTFSNLSRHFGISKWPYRTLRDVQKRFSANESLLACGSISKEKRRKLLEQQKLLNGVVELIYADPRESRDSNTLAVLLRIVAARENRTKFCDL